MSVTPVQTLTPGPSPAKQERGAKQAAVFLPFAHFMGEGAGG